MEKVLFISDVNAGQISESSLEVLSGAIEISKSLSGSLSIALIGESASTAAKAIGGLDIEKIYTVEGDAFSQSRYCSDVTGITALIKESEATLVFAPANARLNRSLPGAALRCGGKIDTHISGLDTEAENLIASRWYYRQRIKSEINRTEKPWVLLIESGIFPTIQPKEGDTDIIPVSVELASDETATSVKGIEAPSSDSQTIKPDAELLFVAGAGWTKQQDNGVGFKEAEDLILGFLEKAQASLGSSKSLVDQSAEGQEVLPFMTHLNQIGQTGATPRHAKGLATCCHGEEPHVVGWRFINDRRAINLDANCGWAQGKADVLYVADAFKVVKKINSLL